MSKIVFLYFRNGRESHFTPCHIEVLAKRLAPDNITPNPPQIISENNTLIGIFNPTYDLPIKSTSVCMGNLINPNADWWRPLAKSPEGSYALFRSNGDTVELVSDTVGSRTMWYALSDDFFIAATSQRAIVFFLRNFSRNISVFGWMLSAGNIGPGLAWDTNIKPLGPGARLLFNRASWRMTVVAKPQKLVRTKESDKDHESRLRISLQDIFENISLDYSKWILALSGGFDSRAILLMLKDKRQLRCVTRGLEENLDNEKDPVYISKFLCNHYGLEHLLCSAHLPKRESAEKVLNRFVSSGEGRADYIIEGELDGSDMYRTIFNSNIAGVIRGNEAFGERPVEDLFSARVSLFLGLLSDYRNFKNLPRIYKKAQIFPKHYLKKKGETLLAWRDRLLYEFHYPYVIPAMDDVALSYVEVVNPLLSKRLVEHAKGWSDHLRCDRALFKKVVNSLSPDIEVPKNNGLIWYMRIVKIKEIVDVIVGEIKTPYARKLFSDKFIDEILLNISSDDADAKVRGSVKIKQNILKKIIVNSLPKPVYTFLKKIIKEKFLREQELLDYNLLAFRVYIICKMTKLLQEDADSLQ